MITINIVSSAEESNLKKVLYNILSTNQKYEYVNIFQSNDLDTGDIIIFGSKIIPYNYNIKSDDKVFIVSEDNLDALNFLYDNGNTAICCGMSTGSSVSYQVCRLIAQWYQYYVNLYQLKENQLVRWIYQYKFFLMTNHIQLWLQ